MGVRRAVGPPESVEGSRQWPLPPGKCYYWRALAYVPDVNGPASSTWRFCIAGAATPTPVPAITATRTPVPAITATSTPVPATATRTPADLTPPDISDLSANPALISVHVPCGATPAP